MLKKENFPAVCLTMFLILTLYSCSNTRYLGEGEVLYKGAKIKIISDAPVNKKALITELDKMTRPKPNQTFLGTRPKLWLYNATGKNPKKGLRRWMKKKLGEPPVLLSAVNPGLTSAVMVSSLNNLGYFSAVVKYKVITGKKKASIEYTAIVSAPYKIKEIIYKIDDAVLNYPIISGKKDSYLKAGDQYSLETIIKERMRIDTKLKNEGFYFFKADYLLYKADTTAGNKSVVLTLTLKPEIPEKGRARYVFNNIYIWPSYKRNRDTVYVPIDTIRIGGYIYLNTDSAFKPQALIRSIAIKKGEDYSRKNHNLTISRLMGMGVFKFAAIIFTDTIIDGKGVLDVQIKLTPILPRSLQLQLEAVTKSNNYSGPALTLSYKNRNLLKGAELFVFNLNANFETQLSGKQKGFNSFEYGASSQLYIPKVIAPFKVHESNYFVPKTKIDLGFRVLHRVQYFNMNALNLSYGYIWKEDAQKEWELTPFSINFAKLTHTTAEFDNLLKNNSYLRKSFEEQFTIGAKCSYTFNSMIGVEKRTNFFFNATLDISGNTIYFIQSLFSSYKSTEAHPYTLFGYRYSQYSKIATDTRYYYAINSNNKIATRFILGAGVPYGNSSTMPYIKQFFSGGSNSIRAFLPRSLGPGSYKLPDTGTTKILLNQSGDIKLEVNLEYRFTIISVLKGALFADAGNVWLMRKNNDLPGGEFNKDKFMKEIAVGTGFGLRADLSFFVLRFDLGIPLRKPSLPENERWVMNKIAFGNAGWRRDNLVLNIAIGYPF
jgi:outer membrane protein insertion porin family